MPFCTNCGHRNPDDANFCSQCGTRLESAAADGIRIDPFRGETLAERAARTERYAEHLRGAFDDGDIGVIEASRMHDLR